MKEKCKITILTSLFRCEEYLDSFLHYVDQIDGKDITEILLLHNAPSELELSILANWLPQLPFVKHIVIPEREGLYKTWNRGIKMAEGEYITNWNVDDIRTPRSMLDEADTLDAHPEAVLTYGDMYLMYKYPIISKDLSSSRDFARNRTYFLKCHQIGCFPMWRKTVHEKYGYFDEQFRLVGDFDFQIRLSRNCILVKTPQNLGAYLEFVPQKLSMNRRLQDIERTTVFLRYGVFDLLDWIITIKAYRKMDVFHYSWENKTIQVSNLFPHYTEYRRTHFWKILLSVWRQPRCILAYIKHHLICKR